MSFEDEVERLRRRIEVALGQKYAGLPDNIVTRAAIASDLDLIHQIFPELDITASLDDDQQHESLHIVS